MKLYMNIFHCHVWFPEGYSGASNHFKFICVNFLKYHAKKNGHWPISSTNQQVRLHCGNNETTTAANESHDRWICFFLQRERSQIWNKYWFVQQMGYIYIMYTAVFFAVAFNNHLRGWIFPGTSNGAGGDDGQDSSGWRLQCSSMLQLQWQYLRDHFGRMVVPSGKLT